MPGSYFFICQAPLLFSAGQLLFYMPGTITFFFFDIMLSNRGKIIFYAAWILIFVNWIVSMVWGIYILFWVVIFSYTLYFIDLSNRIFKIKPVDNEE